MHTIITTAAASAQRSQQPSQVFSDPWDHDGNQYYADAVDKYNRDIADREWEQMSAAYTNAGYREGVTAGKEAAVQTGFDDGFADVGAPLGRQVGLLRGIAHSTHYFLTNTKSDHIPLPLSPPLDSTRSRHSTHGGSGVDHDRAALIERTRAIVQQLDEIHLMDIAPADKEAEEHAKLHSGADDDDDDDDDQMLDGDESESRGIHSLTTDVEIHDADSLEAAFAGMKTVEAAPAPRAPRKVDLDQIRADLEGIVESIGLGRVFAHLRS
ncbi:hypothetical protein BOTBODRAFT_35320 [Botryobasidium botryosum FD-172 SS1]|uniref:Protein YAE1 n=1 Tax=Botryobasidium botryosum (strain FD-172 SS1) TaxID=930990 RepID=A0A067M7B4_BOTB1|nr:hypothetical protein BOTBODRAFT_35320 [Botryobasidium botryosum FD-172 SS1]